MDNTNVQDTNTHNDDLKLFSQSVFINASGNRFSFGPRRYNADAPILDSAGNPTGQLGVWEDIPGYDPANQAGVAGALLQIAANHADIGWDAKTFTKRAAAKSGEGKLETHTLRLTRPGSQVSGDVEFNETQSTPAA